MPLIKNGAVVEPCSAETVNLAEFLSNSEQLLSKNTLMAVQLVPGDDPADLEPHLDRIALIKVDFPKYTDGRGYSQAQLLRRRYGYKGELRATGHVLRDQILYMHRSGFDAYETARADLSSVLEALKEYSAYYQPAADSSKSVFVRRHS